MPFVGSGPPARREHRTVCLPDYQGVGIGNALSDFCASLWTAIGWKARSTTTHPSMIRSRTRSPNWRMTRAPSMVSSTANDTRSWKRSVTRLTAGFEYCGPPAPPILAKTLIGV